MVLVVEIAQIARVVPAVLKGCCGRFGVFPIALRDVGTSYLYLLIVGYAHLDPWQWFAHRFQVMVPERRSGNNGGAFGCPISLEHAKPHMFPTARECGSKVRTSADEEAEVASEALMDGTEEVAAQSERQQRGDSVQ